MHDSHRINKYVYELKCDVKALMEDVHQIAENQKQYYARMDNPPTNPLAPGRPDRWLLASEAGRLIGVDAKTIVSYGKKGMIEWVDIEGTRFYKESDVLKYDKRR